MFINLCLLFSLLLLLFSLLLSLLLVATCYRCHSLLLVAAVTLVLLLLIILLSLMILLLLLLSQLMMATAAPKRLLLMPLLFRATVAVTATRINSNQPACLQLCRFNTHPVSVKWGTTKFDDVELNTDDVSSAGAGLFIAVLSPEFQLFLLPLSTRAAI